MWIEPEIRDNLTGYIQQLSMKAEIPINKLLPVIELSKVKYYRWLRRSGVPLNHNGQIPKTHWLTPEEVKAIIEYAGKHYAANCYFLRDGYRRLTYSMLDQNIVAASPSSVYRILKKAGLLNKWNVKKRNLKGTGFKQPDYSHNHWHIYSPLVD